MAEFLIKAIDANHPDPGIDLAGCYKRGDIVLAKPDGWSWGKCEGPPKFNILKVPGMSIEEAEQYTKPHTELEQKTIEVTKKQYEQDPRCAEFVEDPEVLSEWTEQETMTFAKRDYSETFAEKYFDKLPTIKGIKDPWQGDLVELSGIVTKIRLRGNVEKTKIRRACKIIMRDIILNKDGLAECLDINSCAINKPF